MCVLEESELEGGSAVKRRTFTGVREADRARALSCVCSLQEDYRRTVTEIDEKEYISLRLIISELRNQYVSEALKLALASCTAAGRAL